MSNILKNACRIILLPLFPVSRRNTTPRDGEVASKLFLSHLLAGSVVFFGVLSAQKAVIDEVFVGKWTAITVSICVGFITVLSLLISSYRQRLQVQLTGTDLTLVSFSFVLGTIIRIGEDCCNFIKIQLY